MGNAQSNITKQTLASYTTSVNQAMNSVYSSSIAGCTATNELSIATGGVPDCFFEMTDGAFNLSQTSSSSCNLNNVNINKTTAQFKNTIRNTTKQFIDQNAQNKQGWFATAFSFQINGASNSTEISNTITNSLANSITEICQQEARAMNEAKILLCGTFNASAINIDQNALVTAMVSCINRNVTSIFTTNTVLNQLWQQTDQKLASEQAGFGSVLFWLVIAGVVFIVAILLLFSVFGGGGKKEGDDNGNVEIRQLSSLTSKSKTE